MPATVRAAVRNQKLKPGLPCAHEQEGELELELRLKHSERHLEVPTQDLHQILA